jgi:hypothetical protein
VAAHSVRDRVLTCATDDVQKVSSKSKLRPPLAVLLLSLIRRHHSSSGTPLHSGRLAVAETEAEMVAGLIL